jgi:hypothetical protein
LVFADIDGTNPTARSNAPRGLMRIQASAATNLERPFSGAKSQCLKNGAPTNGHVMALGQSSLNTAHIGIEFQLAHLFPYERLTTKLSCGQTA